MPRISGGDKEPKLVDGKGIPIPLPNEITPTIRNVPGLDRIPVGRPGGGEK